MTVVQSAGVAAGAPPVPGRRRRRHRYSDRSGYLFAAPAMVLASVFSLLPLALAFVYSFAEIAPLSGRISWVGFDNYTQMLTDGTFYRSLVNTVIFTVGTLMCRSAPIRALDAPVATASATSRSRSDNRASVASALARSGAG